MVGNLNERSHLDLLRQAIFAQVRCFHIGVSDLILENVLQNVSASFRLSYLHIPEDLKPPTRHSPASILLRLHHNLGLSVSRTSAEDILDLVNALSPDELGLVSPEGQVMIAESSRLHHILSDDKDMDDSVLQTYLKSTLSLGKLLGLKAGDMALIVNGRVSPFW